MASANPLRDADILEHVFTLLPGNWLFRGAVCSEWRDAYALIADRQALSVCSDGSTKLVTYDNKATLYSAAVASPARMQLARDAGLTTSENDQLQVIAGLHADMETLTALRELGMPFSPTVIEAVALAGRLSIMQQLLPAEQCPRSDSVSHYVARRGSILNWFIAESQTGSDDEMCARAAAGQSWTPFVCILKGTLQLSLAQATAA
eukprot:14566-Heterococcus_DN1.PRE.2